MKRRDFLRLLGLVPAAMAVPWNPAPKKNLPKVIDISRGEYGNIVLQTEYGDAVYHAMNQVARNIEARIFNETPRVL